MAKRQINASVKEATNSVSGVTLPSASDVVKGDFVVNYAKGKETIYIKNDNNEFVPFSSEKQIIDKVKSGTSIADLQLPSGGTNGQVLKKSGNTLVWGDDNAGVSGSGETNQNAFSSVTVGANTINATAKTDNIKFVGSGGVSVSANNANKTVTITGSTNNQILSVDYFTKNESQVPNNGVSLNGIRLNNTTRGIQDIYFGTLDASPIKVYSKTQKPTGETERMTILYDIAAASPTTNGYMSRMDYNKLQSIVTKNVSFSQSYTGTSTDTTLGTLRIDNNTYTIKAPKASTSVAADMYHEPDFTSGFKIASGKGGAYNIYIPTGSASNTLALGNHTHAALTFQANGTTKGTYNGSAGATINISQGTTNGTIAVSGTNVQVRGLGTAAYTASTTYVKRAGDSMTGALTFNGGLSINTNSTITSTTNAITFTGAKITAKEFYEESDRNLKENIKPIEVVGNIGDLEFKEYNYKSDEEKTKKYGVIAQEVEEAGLEHLVHTNDDGMKSVDYISLLILLNQEMRNEIKKLKDEISELKK